MRDNGSISMEYIQTDFSESLVLLDSRLQIVTWLFTLVTH